MNLRTLLTATALVCTGFSGWALADTPQPVPYHYSMGLLQVGKVISMTEQPSNPMECKEITAEMKYIDTQGKPQDISYTKMSDGCDLQN
ncbi:Protein of unknown function [Pseudomonas sp. ok272]|uniref:DUF2790 domain-containing protein n=1 Tax=unclassified Pseudomonas TaxID=196821 RepID=UPI0008C3C991|nr:MULTISPECIES: DUF2790 domain-containing protein [unclassified Pseudomonas]SEN18235.1 Protein of unknown function [Pseudomonas sp. ok272]SFN10165.1 Protein of unknown function [Pseudomonas sp. ok602]